MDLTTGDKAVQAEGRFLPWREVGEPEILATGFGGRGMERRRFYNPNTGETIDWDFFMQKNYSLVFPITEVDGVPHVIAVKQFRPGMMDFFVGLPGGASDADTQDPKAVVLKELLDETGYKPGKTIHLGSAYKNISYERTQGYFFLALDCVKVAEPNTGENEEIEVVLVPLTEWIEYMKEYLEDTQLTCCYRALLHLGYSLTKTD